MQQVKILISCFEAFGEFKENSSQLVAKHLLQVPPTEFAVQYVTLPVTFSGAFHTIRAAIEHYQPDLVCCLAQAASRQDICLEARANNFVLTSFTDNEEVSPKSTAIVENGPAELFCKIPLATVLEKFTPQVPAIVSTDAGSYVCNYLYFQLLEYLQEREIKALLIHLPLAAEQIDVATSDLATSAPSTSAMAETIVSIFYQLQSASC